MARRSSSVALLAGALVLMLVPTASAADTPPLPSSIAAVGDSITQAASSGGSLGADYPANSWSTGTNSTVSSHYLRLLTLDPAISGRAYNRSVSGARMADLNAQMANVVALDPDPGYLTVLIGGNDVCTDTVAQMTSVTDFRSQFVAAMNTLTAGSPGTNVYVVSIPNAYQLWQLFRNNWWARTVWSLGDICQSLLANPTSTQSADVQRRAQVQQRNVDYNTQLAQVCALYTRCRFDGNAVYNTAFTTSDVSGDYFHPSVAGQAKLAAVSWAAGYWPNGGPAPDAAPTPSFTFGCTDLMCSFDGSGSTDDKGIASYAWAYGDGGGGTGVTSSHTYAAGGTYQVTLTVTDTGGQQASTTQAVTVSAGSQSTVRVASLSGSATARKSGWTATVAVSVTSSTGAFVAGATVTGTWSTGASAGCTTTSAGSCSFSTSMNRKTASATYTVTGIAATGHVYDASANVVNSVTVAAP